MTVAPVDSKTVRELAKTHHKAWQLECCEPYDLAEWLEPAINDSRVGVGPVKKITLQSFCNEADSSWCREKKSEKRCILLKLKEKNHKV